MQILREYAMQFVGLPYIWGGDDPIKGMDCSGLVQELLASVGLDPSGDQTAQGLYDHFANNSTPNVMKCGSIVFYGQSVTKITHVAMMIDQYRIIEAGGGGSATVSAEVAAKQNAYIRVRPYNRRSDVVAVLYPSYAKIGVI